MYTGAHQKMSCGVLQAVANSRKMNSIQSRAPMRDADGSLLLSHLFIIDTLDSCLQTMEMLMGFVLEFISLKMKITESGGHIVRRFLYGNSRFESR